MHCPNCSSDNDGARRFCADCGAPLPQICSDCGFANEPAAKFCGGCGVWLERSTPSSAVSPSRAGFDPERRHVTVLFADLVDSTGLSKRLDPEDLGDLIQEYRTVVGSAIARLDGYVSRYVGDGVLAVFGYPVAHEDDAERAVHAALGIVDDLKEFSRRRAPVIGSLIEVRLGLSTGLVVVGDLKGDGTEESDAIVGDTPNVAARLQSIGEPNTVTISEETYRLLGQLFEYQDLGLCQLKGLAEGIHARRVIRPSLVASRFDVTHGLKLLPLVGRREEISLLTERWSRAQEGSGQAVAVCGDAGIGKSRLVRELRNRIAGTEHSRLAIRCSPQHTNSALYPVIDYMQRALQFTRDEPQDSRLEKLEDALKGYDLERDEMVPLFAELLSIPVPAGRYPALDMTPQRKRLRTHRALVETLLEESRRTPVLAVWEDLHWADPSTLEVVNLFIDRLPEARILALLTYRPEFDPPWGSLPYLTQSHLRPLTAPEAMSLARHVAGGRTLPSELEREVVEKTDGVPLFVEELTKSILESELLEPVNGTAWKPNWRKIVSIPETLHDSLMARLDRLADVRHVVQLAACLGRTFSYVLLKEVSNERLSLQEALARLVQAELLYQRGEPPESTYTFKHALIQDAAYQSLLKGKRKEYHERILEALEEGFREIVESEPETAAHHATEAGRLPEAIAYWEKAGERAQRSHANLEAVQNVKRGLELASRLPDTPDRMLLELRLLIKLGVPLTATESFSSPAVGNVYARAREMCDKIGSTPKLFPVLHGLYRFYYVRAELTTAHQICDQMLSIAEREEDSSLLVEATRAKANCLSSTGEPEKAMPLFERSLQLYDAEEHKNHVSVYGSNPRVSSLCVRALTLWKLGHADRARTSIRDALAHARELKEPFTLGWALGYALMLYQMCGDLETSRVLADEHVAVAKKYDFPFWLAGATVVGGWVVAASSLEQGAANMRRGLAAWHAIGAEVSRPYFLSLLADALLRLGRIDEGHEAIEEAVAMAERNRELDWEPELLRLKAELVALDSKSAEGEPMEWFDRALASARRSGSRALELRAATSVAKYDAARGAGSESRRALQALYDELTEGRDTADARAARAALA